MRDKVLTSLCVAALAGPAALAFATGGYFATARLVALLVAWGFVVAALAAGAQPPRTRAAWVALTALAALTGWVAASASWSPLAATARGDVERDVLYLGGLLAALLLVRGPLAARLVEPVLAAGTLVVVGYGLAGRLVPGLVTLNTTASAGGRLEQPLTYWNAMGALAALGVVLCVRLAGEPARARALRAAAAAAAAPLTTGLVLAFSRGALAAAAVGVLVTLLLCPTHPQVRAAAVGLVPGALAALVATRSDAVRSLAGTLAERERAGAVALAVLVALAALAAVLQARLAGRERAREAAGGPAPRAIEALPGPRARTLGSAALPGPRGLAAGVLVAALVAIPAVTAVAGAGSTRDASPAFGATAARLGSVSSNRAEYWRVAWRAAREHPLVGLGTGGFGPAWLRERPFPEAVKDAHSLELEALAELGVVGLALLLTLLGAVAVGARNALRAHPALAAGPAAVLATSLTHASVDWDWEMPALTLVAVACAGALLNAAPPPQQPAD